MSIRRLRHASWLFAGLTLTAAPEDHVVPLVEMERQISSALNQRPANLARVESFLSLDTVQQAIRKSKLDAGQVRTAVRLLGDDELARLASQTDRVRADLAAGALSNQQLTYIVIALATAVIILVIVVA
jgi:hypothetical protein